ncbi:MAG: hypothetical protein L0229_11060 [Blastocatellia bacterium]|nr:hypothetical protein [Blastocatellia bacterium]
MDDDACVIVLSNNYGGTASFMIDGVAAILLNEKYEITQIGKSTGLDQKAVESYIGRYQGDANFIRPNVILTIEKKGDDLFMHWSTGATSGLYPLSEGKFFDRVFGGTVIFVKDDKGEASYLIWRYDRDYEARRIED